ncbi:MAG: carbohydrate-binding family 9-like protein [Candidatus Krumholzibacteriia bacterium]
MHRRGLFWLFAALMAGPALAWNPPLYRCPFTATAPVIDGRLDDPAWQAAPWTADFVDIEGARRPVAPRFRTRARLLWNLEHLFVAVELSEPHVWGTLRDHDAVIFYDNDIELFVDPDGDHHLYGELELNALGTAWDLLLVRPYRDGGPAVNGWTLTGLASAVHVDGTLNDPRDTDRGWTVELAIPWDALRDLVGPRACPPAPGDWWRLNLSRVEWHHRLDAGRYVRVPIDGLGWKGEDNWVWAPQGAVAMHQPETWGFVSFVGPDGVAAGDPRDELRAVYELLWPVYLAQKARDGGYASRLDDLEGLSPATRERVVLVGGPAGWTATLEVAGRRWAVDDEGRLTAPGAD